jgi:hypothetical protein
MADEISSRPILNGRSIIMMWLAIKLISINLQDFYLQKPCKLILAKFKKFTNLSEKKLIFDEKDQLFLDKFTQDFKSACISFNLVRHHSDSRKMWKDFFTELWQSRGFVEFEQKYAERILIPQAMMDDGNMLSISDNLNYFEELCSFSSELKLAPSETQVISSLYDLSGLTASEKDKLLRDGKKMTDIIHQKNKLAAKLTATDSTLKIYQQTLRTVQQESKKEKAMFEQLLDFQHSKNSDLEAQIAELKMELEAAKQELGKQGVDAIPICHICQEVVLAGSQTKLLGCCGYPIHVKCFEQMCLANPNHRPPCPHCRERREERYQFTPLTRNHPLLKHQTAKENKEFSISVCEADFLGGVNRGDKIEPISREERKLSIYEQMVRISSLQKRIVTNPPYPNAGGGAAARR